MEPDPLLSGSFHPHPFDKPKIDLGIGEKIQTTNSLDQVLTALQKSFSRVSADAAKVDKSDALSLISGPISFSLSLKLQPNGDRLMCSSQGDVAVNLSGVIHQDVRARASEKPA